jgi:hypothetical protein
MKAPATPTLILPPRPRMLFNVLWLIKPAIKPTTIAMRRRKIGFMKPALIVWIYNIIFCVLKRTDKILKVGVYVFYTKCKRWEAFTSHLCSAKK